MSLRLRAFLAVMFAAFGLATGLWLLIRHRMVERELALARTHQPRLPRFDGGLTWLNSRPLTPDSLAGRPAVLVVWRDTDPASLEVMPEVEAWYEAYSRLGARVIGVYAPDFSFAADSEVAARAARRLGLGFPIVCDPALAIADQLGGADSLPRIVVADTAGAIIARGAGRGASAAAERALRGELRRLHRERYFPADAAAAPASEPIPRTIYLATGRVRNGPLTNALPGQAQTFTAQFRYEQEGDPFTPYPVGRWMPTADGLTAVRGGAANFVAIRYDAGRVGAVLSPPHAGSTRVWILRDEAWLPREALGADASADPRGASFVEVNEPRLYWLARGGHGERVLKLSPDEPGLTVHALVFDSEPAPDR